MSLMYQSWTFTTAGFSPCSPLQESTAYRWPVFFSSMTAVQCGQYFTGSPCNVAFKRFPLVMGMPTVWCFRRPWACNTSSKLVADFRFDQANGVGDGSALLERRVGAFRLVHQPRDVRNILGAEIEGGFHLTGIRVADF